MYIQLNNSKTNYTDIIKNINLKKSVKLHTWQT